MSNVWLHRRQVARACAVPARHPGLVGQGLGQARDGRLARGVDRRVRDRGDAAVQFHGARALEQGHPLEHLYREVRAPRIYEGASEIQREIIARAVFRQAEARRTE